MFAECFAEFLPNVFVEFLPYVREYEAPFGCDEKVNGPRMLSSPTVLFSLDDTVFFNEQTNKDLFPQPHIPSKGVSLMGQRASPLA